MEGHHGHSNNNIRFEWGASASPVLLGDKVIELAGFD